MICRAECPVRKEQLLVCFSEQQRKKNLEHQNKQLHKHAKPLGLQETPESLKESLTRL